MMPPGRKSTYKRVYAKQVAKLCRLGATDMEIADFFEVDRKTMLRWRASFPEFAEAMKIGKQVADERVERALFERAVGYSHPDVDIRVIDGAVVQTEIIKHYPPDTGAACFWLKNRKRMEWRDKWEGTPEDPIVHEVRHTIVDPRHSNP